MAGTKIYSQDCGDLFIFEGNFSKRFYNNLNLKKVPMDLIKGSQLKSMISPINNIEI